MPFDRLRSRNDRHPFLHVSLVRSALLAEEVEIFFRAFDIARKPEKHIRSCNVRRSVALRCVRPVDEVRRAVLFHNDVGRVEIAVAELVVFGHALKPCVQFIFYTFVKISQVDFLFILSRSLVSKGHFLD